MVKDNINITQALSRDESSGGWSGSGKRMEWLCAWGFLLILIWHEVSHTHVLQIKPTNLMVVVKYFIGSMNIIIGYSWLD